MAELDPDNNDIPKYSEECVAQADIGRLAAFAVCLKNRTDLEAAAPRGMLYDKSVWRAIDIRNTRLLTGIVFPKRRFPLIRFVSCSVVAELNNDMKLFRRTDTWLDNRGPFFRDDYKAVTLPPKYMIGKDAPERPALIGESQPHQLEDIAHSKSTKKDAESIFGVGTTGLTRTRWFELTYFIQSVVGESIDHMAHERIE